MSINANQVFENKLVAALIHIMGDELNRSLSALEQAGVLDLAELRSGYMGVGSEYYDLVTAKLEETADHARTTIRGLIAER